MKTQTKPTRTFRERDLNDPQKNRQWRKAMDRRARTDIAYRRQIIARARRDVIFFLKALCWLDEPRTRRDKSGAVLPGKIPFIPWPHQVPVILKIRQHVGIEDVVIEKSRDEGMSWTALLMALHDWLFVKGAKIGLVSSTEDLADNPGDMDSLMGKLDWELEQMPLWLVGPRRERLQGNDFGYVRNTTKHYLMNCRTRATINAVAGGPDIFRGGRKLWILMDEMASKQWLRSNRDVDSMYATSKSTDSRLMVSTPSGPVGAYHDVVHEESDVVRVQIRWSENPTKNRGLYRMEKGVPVAIDPANNPLPPEYDPPNAKVLETFRKLRSRGFDLSKGLRSPWKDRECLRPKETPQSEARELDLDYGGAADRIFGETFRGAVIKTEQPPFIEGAFSVNDMLDKWTFDRCIGGPFHLWCNLDDQGKPPMGKYVVACDSATGEATSKFGSNSSLIVANAATGEQVAEFVSKNIGRGEFADFAIGVCKWFHGAFLAWEHGGPGTAFTKRVLRREYAYHYRRKVEWRSSAGKETKDPGWVTTDETKQLLLDELKLAVICGDLLVRSKAFRMECELYVQKDNSMQHAATKGKDKTHADRVIAMGVLVQAIKDMAILNKSTNAVELTPWGSGEPPYGTAAHRQWEYEQNQRDRSDDWDDRSTFDLSQRDRRPQLIGAR